MGIENRKFTSHGKRFVVAVLGRAGIENNGLLRLDDRWRAAKGAI
jgi:hypothetical protein